MEISSSIKIISMRIQKFDDLISQHLFNQINEAITEENVITFSLASVSVKLQVMRIKGYRIPIKRKNTPSGVAGWLLA